MIELVSWISGWMIIIFGLGVLLFITVWIYMKLFELLITSFGIKNKFVEYLWRRPKD